MNIDNLGFRNLAALWGNYAAAGATHLVIARVVETRDELDGYRQVVPGADITVVRLRASDEALQGRVLGRKVVTGERYVRRALELARLMDDQQVEDHLVETSGRTVLDVARDVLHRAGWV